MSPTFMDVPNATIISVRFKYKDTVKQEAVGVVQLSCSRDAGTGEKEFVERRVLKIPLRCHYDSFSPSRSDSIVRSGLPELSHLR